MFNAEERLLAARLIECALGGRRGAMLIDCIRKDFPDATNQSIVRAAFLAVTRREVSEQVVPPIHEVAILLPRK